MKVVWEFKLPMTNRFVVKIYRALNAIFMAWLLFRYHTDFSHRPFRTVLLLVFWQWLIGSQALFLFEYHSVLCILLKFKWRFHHVDQLYNVFKKNLWSAQSKCTISFLHIFPYQHCFSSDHAQIIQQLIGI